MSCLSRCPYFSGVLNEGFHCMYIASFPGETYEGYTDMYSQLISLPAHPPHTGSSAVHTSTHYTHYTYIIHCFITALLSFIVAGCMGAATIMFEV